MNRANNKKESISIYVRLGKIFSLGLEDKWKKNKYACCF